MPTQHTKCVLTKTPTPCLALLGSVNDRALCGCPTFINPGSLHARAGCDMLPPTPHPGLGARVASSRTLQGHSAQVNGYA